MPTRITTRLITRLGSIGALLLLLVGCAPLVRPATFVGARDQITDATLIGPFDGQVVDISTGEPVAEAIVVGVWPTTAATASSAPTARKRTAPPPTPPVATGSLRPS